MTPADHANTVREDEIVAEWWLDRDHWPEGQAIRRLARAVVQRETAAEAEARKWFGIYEEELTRADAAEAQRDRQVKESLRIADERDRLRALAIPIVNKLIDGSYGRDATVTKTEIDRLRAALAETERTP